RRHTRSDRDWSSDVCSSDLQPGYRFSSAGISLVYRGTFYRLFAAAFSRPCHRGNRTVETFAAAAAPAFSDVVWPSSVRILYTARSEERRVGKEFRSVWLTEL